MIKKPPKWDEDASALLSKLERMPDMPGLTSKQKRLIIRAIAELAGFAYGVGYEDGAAANW